LCDTFSVWVCLFGFCFIFSVVQKLFICGKLWRWSVHGRRPNWLINQTSNAHNGHASPESKFEPGQEPPLRGIRTRIRIRTRMWVRRRTIYQDHGDHSCQPRVFRKCGRKGDIQIFIKWGGTSLQVQVGLGWHCSRLDFLRIPATRIPYGFRSRALAVSLSSAGSQLVAIWPANYLHIRKISNNADLIFFVRHFWNGNWKNMDRSLRSMVNICCFSKKNLRGRRKCSLEYLK